MVFMRNDLEIITRVFPKSQDVLRVYAIGDVHVGSPEFDEQTIKKKIDINEKKYPISKSRGNAKKYNEL